MFSSPQNKRNTKRVVSQRLDDVATRRRGSTNTLVAVRDSDKAAALAQANTGPYPTPLLIDSDGRLTLVAGAYPVGTAKYLTKDISAIVGDWEFTILCRRQLIEFGVTVTNAAGDKSVSLIQRSSSPNNAIVRQTTYATVATPVTFTDNNIYQNTVQIFYNIRKVGTNILFYTSLDGDTFTLRHTEALATHLITADRIGFYLGSSASAEGAAHWFIGVGGSSGSYTDMFDNRSLDAAWVWYNDSGTATATEVDLFYGYEDDSLPLTLQVTGEMHGTEPPNFMDNNREDLPFAQTFEFQYSPGIGLPDPYGQEDTLSLTATISFTHE
jgi:hypothetical protein